MSVPVMIWLIWTYVLVSFMVFLVDGVFASAPSEHLSRFLAFDALRLQPIPVLPIKIPTISLEWLTSVRAILLWELAVFDSAGGRWIRYLLFLPISAGVALGLAINVGPRMVQAVATLISAIPKPLLLVGAISQLFAGGSQLIGG